MPDCKGCGNKECVGNDNLSEKIKVLEEKLEGCKSGELSRVVAMRRFKNEIKETKEKLKKTTKFNERLISTLAYVEDEKEEALGLLDEESEKRRTRELMILDFLEKDKDLREGYSDLVSGYQELKTRNTELEIENTKLKDCLSLHDNATILVKALLEK